MLIVQLHLDLNDETFHAACIQYLAATLHFNIQLFLFLFRLTMKKADVEHEFSFVAEIH